MRTATRKTGLSPHPIPGSPGTQLLLGSSWQGLQAERLGRGAGYERTCFPRRGASSLEASPESSLAGSHFNPHEEGRAGQGRVGVFSGTGTRKRQPRGLRHFFQASLQVRGQRRPSLGFADKRLSGGVPNSGLGCLPLPLHLLSKSWPTPKAQLFLSQTAFRPRTLSAQTEISLRRPDPMPTPAVLELGGGDDPVPALA